MCFIFPCYILFYVFLISRNQISEISGFPNSRISEFPNCQISEFPNFHISEFLNFEIFILKTFKTYLKNISKIFQKYFKNISKNISKIQNLKTKISKITMSHKLFRQIAKDSIFDRALGLKP